MDGICINVSEQTLACKVNTGDFVYRWKNTEELLARFRLCQVFLLSLKLDGFFQLVFSIFWFVVMTQENYQHGNSASVAWYVLHLLLTIVQFPAPFVARYGLCSERPPFMIAFVIVHVLIVVDFIIVLQQSVSSWVFWVLAGKMYVIWSSHPFTHCWLFPPNSLSCYCFIPGKYYRASIDPFFFNQSIALIDHDCSGCHGHTKLWKRLEALW